MSLQNLLEKALVIAIECHKGQTDKGGNPYILHPLAVASRVHKLEEKIVAILHDVVEDTHMTFDRLRELGFPEYIVSAIDSVTRRDGETYDEFLFRSSLNRIGKVVKIADILENSNFDRIPNEIQIKLGEKQIIRLKKKYARGLSILTNPGWVFTGRKWVENPVFTFDKEK
ncbi:HD domain-containing protein [Bacillus toyonensis]|uniref:HD domain-containing protein n=1 Tax=Bacillus toyonensis TaxID=155322 RepID=UPI002E1D49FA|nr:HD domain-containing protein [Bacillus toyonensis]